MRGASRPVDLGQWRGKRGGSAVRAARLGFYRGVRLQGELVTEPRRPSVCGVTDWVTVRLVRPPGECTWPVTSLWALVWPTPLERGDLGSRPGPAVYELGDCGPISPALNSLFGRVRMPGTEVSRHAGPRAGQREATLPADLLRSVPSRPRLLAGRKGTPRRVPRLSAPILAGRADHFPPRGP